MTQSSNYPFYVQLDGTNGLMLGQHVYVEPDIGQQEVKTGIWLSDYFINDVDSNPYVWADDGNGKLEKRSVTLGTYDENMMEYQITDGLKEEDAITFPEDGLEEGMKTAQAIGDDALQSRGGGRVSPESFTHGTSAQRVEWLRRGYESGDPASCDTFAAL